MSYLDATDFNKADGTLPMHRIDLKFKKDVGIKSSIMCTKDTTCWMFNARQHNGIGNRDIFTTCIYFYIGIVFLFLIYIFRLMSVTLNDKCICLRFQAVKKVSAQERKSRSVLFRSNFSFWLRGFNKATTFC